MIPHTLSESRRHAIRDAVMAELDGAASLSLARGRRHRRAAAVVGISSAVMAVGAGAAAAAVHYGPAPAAPVLSARCYGSISTDTSESFDGYSVAVARQGMGSRAKIADPVPLCVSLWHSGAFPRSASTAVDPGANHPAPSLTACVDAQGRVSVYPGTAAVCDTVGQALDTNSTPYVAP